VQALAKGRAGAALVVLGSQVLAVGGENGGDLVPELLALVDLGTQQVGARAGGPCCRPAPPVPARVPTGPPCTCHPAPA
jgi:hypothetical protein